MVVCMHVDNDIEENESYYQAVQQEFGANTYKAMSEVYNQVEQVATRQQTYMALYGPNNIPIGLEHQVFDSNYDRDIAFRWLSLYNAHKHNNLREAIMDQVVNN